jgi:hypothetical protein
MDLEGGLRDPQTARAARELLKRLRQRHDLFAAAASSTTVSSKPTRPRRRCCTRCLWIGPLDGAGNDVKVSDFCEALENSAHLCALI